MGSMPLELRTADGGCSSENWETEASLTGIGSQFQAVFFRL